MIDFLNNFLFQYNNHIKREIASKAICLCVIIHISVLIPDIYNLLSSHGLIDAGIQNSFIFSTDPRLSWIVGPLMKLGVSESVSILAIVCVYMLSLLCVIFGYARLICSFFALFLHVMILDSTYLYGYGADYIETFLLFINLFLNIDAIVNVGKGNIINSFAFRLLQIQLFIIYFFSGFGKAMGTDWWNGNAIWFMMNTYGNLYLKDISVILSSYPFFFKISGWLIMIMELLYPILIMFKKTRKTAFFFMVAMHLAIAFIIKLYFFGAIMIVFNIIAFGEIFKINKKVIEFAIWFDEKILSKPKFEVNVKTQNQ